MKHDAGRIVKKTGIEEYENRKRKKMKNKYKKTW